MHIRRICLSNVAGFTSSLFFLRREYSLTREAIDPAAGADNTSSTKSDGYLLRVSGTPSCRSSTKENRFIAAYFPSTNEYEDPLGIREVE
jgi:hypothetical protein